MRYHYPGNIRELENVLKRCYFLSTGGLIKKQDVEFEIQVEKKENEIPESIYKKMIFEGYSFWDVVHKPLLKRELNRREAKEIIATGLKQTKGSYKSLLSIFNVDQDIKSYKRFMDIIRIHKLR